MRLLGWVLRLMAFVLLLGFALNNQAPVTLNFLFGWQWQGPMALIVLAVFALGCAVGAVGMLPAWWRQRRAASALRVAQPSPPATTRATSTDGQATAMTGYHSPPVAKAGDDRPDGV